MALDTKQVKLIQINVWLAKQQKVEVLARETVSGHLCDAPNPKTVVFKRTGVTSRPGTIDVVCQIADKLCRALRSENPDLSILVDGSRIEPDPKS